MRNDIDLIYFKKRLEERLAELAPHPWGARRLLKNRFFNSLLIEINRLIFFCGQQQ